MKSPHEQNENIPPNFYRISTKALILDETRTKFLITKESNGKWEFPGGGWEYGLDAQENVARELKEEMGIIPDSVSELPAYIVTGRHDRTGSWVANMYYETTIPHLDFVPSRECNEVRFVDKDSLPDSAYSNVIDFAKIFNSKKHKSTL